MGADSGMPTTMTYLIVFSIIGPEKRCLQVSLLL